MIYRKEIRLSAEELEQLEQLSAEQELNSSQYIRMLITNQPRAYPGIQREIRNLVNEVNHIGNNINQITKNNNSGLYHEKDKKRLYILMKQLKELVGQMIEKL